MSKKIMALAILAIVTPAWAEVTGSLTTGVDYTTGEYGGTTSTDVLYIPVTGKIEFDTLFFKLTVPYISVTSDGTAVIKGMGRIRTTTSTKTTTQSGLGDIIASAGYIFFENKNWLLDIAGNIKFGTADANKNLGTGENDYSAQIDGFYTVNKTTPFATVGYKIVGAPAGVDVNNIVYTTVGVSQKYTDKTRFGAMLDAAQSSSELSPGTRELSVFTSHTVSNTLKTQVSLMKGLSDSSPDFGGSLMLTGLF
jgi:hypothetical protein